MGYFLSKSCQHTLRALLYLVSESADGYVLVKDIAAQLDIPYHVLAKLFQSLVRRGLLISQKGPSGGFRLAKDVGNIKLLEIIEAVDGLAFMDGCLLGTGQCSEANPCPVHGEYDAIRDKLVKMLSSQSLASFIEGIRKNETYIVKP